MQCVCAQLKEPLPENRQIRIIIQDLNFHFLFKFGEENINTYLVLFKRVSAWQPVIDSCQRTRNNGKAKPSMDTDCNSETLTKLNAVTKSEERNSNKMMIKSEKDQKTTLFAFSNPNPVNLRKEISKNDLSDVLVSAITNFQVVMQDMFDKLQKTLNQVPSQTVCSRCGRSAQTAAVCCSLITGEIRKRAGL